MVLEIFNLYDLFVNQVFGSLILANIGFIILLIIIGFITNQSQATIFAICLFAIYMLVIAMMPLLGIIIFIFAAVYMGYEIISFAYTST